MRKFVLLSLLVGSVGVPSFLLSRGEGTSLSSMWNKFSGGADDEQADDESSAESPQVTLGVNEKTTFANGTPLLAVDYNVEVAPTMSLEKALNFRTTIPWILGNWPQVSTGIVDEELFGYRVPLVTGTSESDVTGSLTYYFGPDKLLRRIVLKGDTGDARPLVGWLTARFGITRFLSEEQGAYLYRKMDDETVSSELKVRPRAIVRASDPHRRFEVFLTLNRPPPDPQQ